MNKINILKQIKRLSIISRHIRNNKNNNNINKKTRNNNYNIYYTNHRSFHTSKSFHSKKPSIGNLVEKLKRQRMEKLNQHDESMEKEKRKKRRWKEEDDNNNNNNNNSNQSNNNNNGATNKVPTHLSSESVLIERLEKMEDVLAKMTAKRDQALAKAQMEETQRKENDTILMETQRRLEELEGIVKKQKVEMNDINEKCDKWETVAKTEIGNGEEHLAQLEEMKVKFDTIEKERIRLLRLNKDLHGECVNQYKVTNGHFTIYYPKGGVCHHRGHCNGNNCCLATV